jgi:hypothetical protein
MATFSFNKPWLAAWLCSEHMNPVHVVTPDLRSNSIVSCHLCVRIQNGLNI